MGRAWMAIKDGIEQGIIFRKGLKEYCTGKKWNVNPKTFNANIKRNVQKSGELADVVFRKNHRKEETNPDQTGKNNNLSELAGRILSKGHKPHRKTPFFTPTFNVCLYCSSV